MVATLSFNGKEFAASLAITPPRFGFFDAGDRTPLSLELINQCNLFIKSDNLEALKFLAHINSEFHVIYIDPPYNSGLKFTYNDLFKNNGAADSNNNWLCMMFPRLILAHKVLSENGVIFISIDDRENANLTILMREIFGRENHIGTIKWRKKNKPSFLDKHIGNVIEYVLIFSKNKNKLLKLAGKKSTENSRPVLNASNPISTRIIRKNTEAKCSNGVYLKGSYTNRTLKIELENDALIFDGKLTNDIIARGRFRVSQKILDESVFITKSFGLRRKISFAEQVTRHATDDATIDFESNEDAEIQLKSLFNGNKVFDFPKPVGLIKNLIKMYQKTDNDKIKCLDFFAGSATLSQAVHELNLIEGNNYSFCCIQNEEKLSKTSNYKNLETVADIAEQRIKIIEEKYKIFPRCKIFTPKKQTEE